MQEQTVGYLCTVIACLGFGSNYIPVKKVDTGDGMFFSLCVSAGVLLVGIVQWLVAGLYKFEPFAMLGGAIWATGNLMVPFIVQRCGLGVGQLVWSVTNMLSGWACGTFGLLGKDRDPVAHPGLNFLGVALAILSLLFFRLMRPPTDACRSELPSFSRESLRDPSFPPPPLPPPPPEGGFLFGVVAALVGGVFMGLNFNPPTYLQQLGEADAKAGRPPRHSQQPMDYVIAHFSGIFVFTAAAFAVYWWTSRSRYVSKKLVLPGLACGAMWGCAQVGWFQANGVLSYVVAFPIIVGVPGVIAALWGIALFGENKGRRNMGLLASVIVVQAAGVLCIALSKG